MQSIIEGLILSIMAVVVLGVLLLILVDMATDFRLSDALSRWLDGLWREDES